VAVVAEAFRQPPLKELAAFLDLVEELFIPDNQLYLERGCAG